MRQAMQSKRERTDEQEEDRAARHIQEQIDRADAALPEGAKVGRCRLTLSNPR